MPKSQVMKISFLPNLIPHLQSFITCDAALTILMRNKSRFSQPYLLSIPGISPHQAEKTEFRIVLYVVENKTTYNLSL